jgi:hypothetical protein
MREAPEVGSKYWVPDLDIPGVPTVFEWRDDDYDRWALKYGLCHSTVEAAVAHARALIGGGDENT